MTALNVKDIAWLAGFLEGEGSFVIRGKTNAVRIMADSTDLDVIERAAALLGCRSFSRRAPNGATHFKPVYCLRVGRERAAGWMMTLYPLMGARRQTRIRECLARWRQMVPKGWVAHRARYGCQCQQNTGSCQKGKLHPVEVLELVPPVTP